MESVLDCRMYCSLIFNEATWSYELCHHHRDLSHHVLSWKSREGRGGGGRCWCPRAGVVRNTECLGCEVPFWPRDANCCFIILSQYGHVARSVRLFLKVISSPCMIIPWISSVTQRPYTFQTGVYCVQTNRTAVRAMLEMWFRLKWVFRLQSQLHSARGSTRKTGAGNQRTSYERR